VCFAGPPMLMDGDQQTIQLAKTINMRKQQTLNNVASLHSFMLQLMFPKLHAGVCFADLPTCRG